MLPRMLAPLAALTMVCVGASGAVFACGTTTDEARPTEDGGQAPVGPPLAICPALPPPEGADCRLPEGTTCLFDECAATVARCTGGAWRRGATASPRCPAETPESDSACSPCWPRSVTCHYGSSDCTAPDASLNTATASCVDEKWTVEFQGCRDAGADVQGDAGRGGD